VVEIRSQPTFGEINQPATIAGGIDMKVNNTSAKGGKKVTRQS